MIPTYLLSIALASASALVGLCCGWLFRRDADRERIRAEELQWLANGAETARVLQGAMMWLNMPSFSELWEGVEGPAERNREMRQHGVFVFDSRVLAETRMDGRCNSWGGIC